MLAETQICVVEKDPARGEADYACHLLWLATEELGHGSLLEGNKGVLLWRMSSRPVWGVRPLIPTADHMGYASRGGPAHEKKPCGA